MHVHVCVTLHGYLHVNVNVNASSRSLTHPVFFHPCLPGTLFRSPLMSASPSSMTARVQSSLNQLPAGRPSYSSFLPFLWCVQGVSVWQTIPDQLPWQTEAGALVPAGHTKLFSSQLVCLSLWLNAWCHWIQRISMYTQDICSVWGFVYMYEVAEPETTRYYFTPQIFSATQLLIQTRWGRPRW